MKSLQLFIICILLQLSVFGQTRTVRGIVYDKQYRNHIEGVSVTPDFFENDSTDNRGRFKVYYPRKYKDTIRFSHPDYYPYLTKINNNKPQFIYLVPKKILLDTLFYDVFEGNAVLNGRIFGIVTRNDLDSVTLKLENSKKVGYSAKDGKFEFVLPISTDRLIASKKGYFNDTILLSGNNFFKNHEVFLVPDYLKSNSSIDKCYYSNIFMVAPNELLNVSIGLKYVHFIKRKHAFGLQFSYYIPTCRSIPLSVNVNYSGIKVSPTYRYYFMRSLSNQSFVEGKIIGGYLNFKSLPYREASYQEDFEFLPASFYSYGIGINWGFEDIVLNSHAIFGFSIGFQYFPMYIEYSYTNEHNIQYDAQTWWWYLYGPGSIVEIKIYIGGIF